MLGLIDIMLRSVTGIEENIVALSVNLNEN